MVNRLDISFADERNGISMESLKKFTDKVQKFYGLVESHESQVQNWIKETRKPLHSITNQSVFFRAVVPKDSLVNTPFERFEGFREDLIENILTSLQAEYDLLEEVRNKINAANEKLHKEQTHLETSYTSLRAQNSIDVSNLNPCSPSFEHIIVWSQDIWCYYHSYYLQISHALQNLNFEDENTVKALTQSFKEDSELKKQVNRIRSFKFAEFQFVV